MENLKENFLQNYSELRQIKPKTIRSLARNVLLNGYSTFNGFHVNQLKKPRVQFIYLHHLFKDEEKKLLHLIENLQKHHEFISYKEAVSRILKNKIDKPYIAISVDDGFKNNLRIADILDSFDIKACFFINPSIINISDYAALKAYCSEKLHLPPVEFMSWGDIDHLLQNGHEIGSHTMEHINIANTPPDEILRDMNTTYEVLKLRCGKAEHFAFPFGRFFHFNETGRKACFDAGFTSCASAERGCHIPNASSIAKDKLCLRRDHVILDWDFRHIEYFLINNARNTSSLNNLFPYSSS